MKYTLFATATLLLSAGGGRRLASAYSHETLQDAILNDMLMQYSTYMATPESNCPSSTATNFTDVFPGTNTNSNWNAGVTKDYEAGLFQTHMSWTDPDPSDGGGDLSWEVRFGSGGNIYSHYVPHMHGETMAPQAHVNAPWVDEVHQSVSVSGLNSPNGACKDDPKSCYFIHQAGAYQRDSPYTDDKPFYSPSLARHCKDNYCIFAAWGTHAHVATPFTSPVMYLNKYANCGNGIIEHTQLIHNFANPLDPQSTATNVDLTYFNVAWTGISQSHLPWVLEPQPSDGSFSFKDPATVDYLPIKSWGNDNPTNPNPDANGCYAGREERQNIKDLGGYTSFAAPPLLVKQPEQKRWCRKPGADCYTESCPKPFTGAGCCMAQECRCDTAGNAQTWPGYTEIDLKVQPNSTPNCAFHRKTGGPCADWLCVECDFHDLGFGQTRPYLYANPSTGLGFYRADTGVGIDNVRFLRHWSFSPTNRKTYFALNILDDAVNPDLVARQVAIDNLNAIFSNVGNSEPLGIEFRLANEPPTEPPANYTMTASSIPAFTYVYGKGQEYVSNDVAGNGRRRTGSTARDFTVFTINWWGGSRIEAGEAYITKQFLFSSTLGDVKAKADALVPQVEIAEFSEEQYSPRRVQIFQDGGSFTAVAASSVEGTTTACPSSSAQLVSGCSGYSTPKGGFVAYFYVKCGASTHFGLDPYHFTPNSGDTFTFPGHSNTAETNWEIRSYLCNGEPASVRPTWQLLGFFNPTTCTSLADVSYDDTICQPTSVPTSNPTKGPSDSPVTPAPVTPSPTKTQTTAPVTSAPSKVPTVKPVTDSPSKVPTVKPVTDSPSKVPTVKPVTESPIVSKSPSKSVTTSSSCNFEVMLHIVDQTKSLCQNKKVSCKVAISDGTYIDGLEVRVAEMDAQDIIPHEASVYFDEADSTTMAVASDDDGCISHTPAADGMVNVAVACGTFKMNDQPVGQRVCALSDDLVTVVEGGKVTMEFMLLVLKDKPSNNPRAAKSKRAKGSGGFNRFLQEGGDGSDLVVTFPQSFIWESSEELYYPMILSSLTVWTVDACLLLPPGHVLTAVMDANSTEPLLLDGECTHVTVPGEDLVLLFQPVEDIPWGSRALANKKSATDEIRGHIKATEKGGTHSKGQSKTIDFSTKARGRSSAKGKGAQGAGD